MLLGKWRLGWKSERLDKNLAWWSAETLDRYVARTMQECDVLMALSSVGLHAAKVAKRRGSQYICDRGSSHISYQQKLLDEEFRRWGQEFRGIDNRVIFKEQEEYALADRITVPSEFVRHSFLEMGVPADKLKKVPYGVNLSSFSKIADPSRDTFDVLFVGQVSLRKGVPYLLAAFEQLGHPRKRLRIVGAMQPDMEFFLSTRRFSNVDFVGPVPRSTLSKYFSTSHVMVLPSIEEGLALVQGQALACGCPLISSTNSGGEDLFSHGKEGFIVPIRDAAAIADRLEQLAADSGLRTEMSNAALRRVRHLGGWSTYGDNITAVCKELTKLLN